MVRQGQVTAELIHAENREPFQEHIAADGKVYVEVEPDIDYFIHLVHHDDLDDDSDEQSFLKIRLELDGEEFKNSLTIPSGATKIKGISSYRDNQKFQTAFRFRMQESTESSQTGKPWLGCVKVKVYDTINRGTICKIDRSGTESRPSDDQWGGGTVDGFISPSMKKVVRSVKGQYSAVVKTRAAPPQPENGMKYVVDIVRGEHMYTMELYYCTALGLVRAGVLPKPPDFELDLVRKKKPFTTTAGMTPGLLRCLQVKPAFVVTTTANKELGMEEKRCEVFDLIEADSDDDISGPNIVSQEPTQEPTQENGDKLSETPKRARLC